MIGRSGKCPVNCGSLAVTFLIATTRCPGSNSITRSIRRNGYRCGMMRMMSAASSGRVSPSMVIGRSSAAWSSSVCGPAGHERGCTHAVEEVGAHLGAEECGVVDDAAVERQVCLYSCDLELGQRPSRSGP